MSEILVVGSLAYDSIETPSGRADRTLGGSANYFSLAAALFSKVNVVGVVGDDYEDQHRQLLIDRGVDLKGMVQSPGKTFHWEGSYEGDLNEATTKKTELNVFEHFNPELPHSYQNTPFVFLANIAPELQLQVLSQVQKPLFVAMDTMNFWILSRKEELKKVLKRVDALLINEHEAMMLTGSGNAVGAAKKIVEIGPKVVVIKRGEYGFIMYSTSMGFFALPAFPIGEVIDPTGAGDTFAGGFMGYLSSLGRRPTDQDFKRACAKGTILASFTIEDFGVQKLKSVTKGQVFERLKGYQSVISLGTEEVLI